MSVIKETFYGHVRRTAFTLWKGPDYVENVEEEEEDNPLGGDCILRLALRKGETAKPMIEARAVYASLRPDDSHDALLRAIYWDNKAIAHTTHSTPLDTPFKIAARFVQIPLALLYQWIHLLENLQASVQTTSHEDDTLPICTLKVETNTVSSLFEKTWQMVEGENEDINRIWQVIWQEMEQVLQTAPIVTAVEESFPDTQIEPDTYDFQSYQPSLSLP